MLNPLNKTTKNFEFESGIIIDELKLEYATLGTVERDSEGYITNALLFLHGWSGNYASFKRFEKFTTPGQPFDKNKYFIIVTTALGTPPSSAPSTSKLPNNFPAYTIKDMVNAQYQLLTEHFKIRHLKGVIGASMGGFQTLEWGISYPEFMDFIIPIVTSSSVQGRNLAIFQLMNNLIEDYPTYNNGHYADNPVEAVANANKLLFLFAYSSSNYNVEYPSKDLLLNALNEQGIQGRTMDANNIIWRNNAAISYDVTNELYKIKAKTLIIGIEGDQFFPPEIDAIPLQKSLKNSELYIFKSILGHLGINELEKAQSTIKEFMDKI